MRSTPSSWHLAPITLYACRLRSGVSSGSRSHVVHTTCTKTSTLDRLILHHPQRCAPQRMSAQADIVAAHAAFRRGFNRTPLECILLCVTFPGGFLLGARLFQQAREADPAAWGDASLGQRGAERAALFIRGMLAILVEALAHEWAQLDEALGQLVRRDVPQR